LEYIETLPAMLRDLKDRGFDVSTCTFYRWRRDATLAGFIEPGSAGQPTRCEISSWENFVAVIVPTYYAAKPEKCAAAGRASGEARRAVTTVNAPTQAGRLVANVG